MCRRNILLLFLLFLFSLPSESQIPSGEWWLLHSSIGISAMHMQLLYTNQVVMFDRTDFGRSNLSLPLGKCRLDPSDVALKVDCTAHSVIYTVASNALRPLVVQTDTWCSSGAVFPNGTLLQTGGYNDGDRAVRLFSVCDGCDWDEMTGYLAVRRWYATNQILPDGRVIIVGGRRQFSYEFIPRTAGADGEFMWPLDFLKETRDVNDENNLYPFLHLLPDGNLFILANTRGILFDYAGNRILREYPSIPDGHPRNYPSSGSSVLLPLRLDAVSEGAVPAEVMVCGGAPRGSFERAGNGEYVLALDTCARLRVMDQEPRWEMERMPFARVMGDMLLLPTGDVLIINGARNGTAGWELARDPALNPVLYKADRREFRILRGSTIPRMYHSAAVVVADGRVLVGGSNPHVFYNFTGVLHPTELSLESFSPPYLAPRYIGLRPSIRSPGTNVFLTYGETFTVTFDAATTLPPSAMGVTLLYPSFTTHSLAMNQRLISLRVLSRTQIAPFTHHITVIGPPSPAVTPPGYYLLFVVHAGIPSPGIWLRIH